MNEFFERVFALGLGVFAGYVYFGGLWLTLKYLPKVDRQIPFAVGSFFLRLSVTAVSFYGIATMSDWIGVLVCLTGVLVMRTIFVHRIKGEDKQLTGFGSVKIFMRKEKEMEEKGPGFFVKRKRNKSAWSLFRRLLMRK